MQTPAPLQSQLDISERLDLARQCNRQDGVFVLRLSLMQPFVGKLAAGLQALRRCLGPSLRVEPQATHRLKHHQASQVSSGDAFSSNMSRRRLQTTHLQCIQTRHSHDGIEHKHLLYLGTLHVSLQLGW